MKSRPFRLAAPLLATFATCAAAAPPADLDARIETAMQQHGVPGLAIAIVEDGEVALARGYGVRRLGGREPVDADTIFPTGSTGKAFTAAALAVLVDEGKLGWDDPVADHLPDFRMADPWVTRELTVRDLLVHRSGLGLGAGDLLYVPRTSRSRADVVRALRHIEAKTSFRSGYAYDNILYVVAGQLVEAVSGRSWEDFVLERLLRPAGMRHATTTLDARFANANRAQPHARIDGALRGLGRQQVLDEKDGLGQTAAPAGGLAASANDLARWLQVQLAQGAIPGAQGGDPARLFSEAAAREMWTPQVLVPIRPFPEPIADATPQFQSYALGWSVQDYRGVKVVQHGGAVFGVLTFVVLVPQEDVGIAITINSEDVHVLRGIGNELLDHYLGLPDAQHDWVADFAQWNAARLKAGADALAAAAAGVDKGGRGRPSLPLAAYAGDYADAWYGPIGVAFEGGRLRLDFTQSPGMVATLSHHRHDTFRADWDDKAIEPAYVTFSLDAEGKVARITMKAVSPTADFSYNYQDLEILPAR